MTVREEYLKLQGELKELINNGVDESEEGEELRCKMDLLWDKLTTEEKLEINKDVKLPG